MGRVKDLRAVAAGQQAIAEELHTAARAASGAGNHRDASRLYLAASRAHGEAATTYDELAKIHSRRATIAGTCGIVFACVSLVLVALRLVGVL